MTDHTSGRWDQPLPILELLKSGETIEARYRENLTALRGNKAAGASLKK